MVEHNDNGPSLGGEEVEEFKTPKHVGRMGTHYQSGRETGACLERTSRRRVYGPCKGYQSLRVLEALSYPIQIGMAKPIKAIVVAAAYMDI